MLWAKYQYGTKVVYISFLTHKYYDIASLVRVDSCIS